MRQFEGGWGGVERKAEAKRDERRMRTWWLGFGGIILSCVMAGGECEGERCTGRGCGTGGVNCPPME